MFSFVDIGEWVAVAMGKKHSKCVANLAGYGSELTRDGQKGVGWRGGVRESLSSEKKPYMEFSLTLKNSLLCCSLNPGT